MAERIFIYNDCGLNSSNADSHTDIISTKNNIFISGLPMQNFTATGQLNCSETVNGSKVINVEYGETRLPTAFIITGVAQLSAGVIFLILYQCLRQNIRDTASKKAQSKPIVSSGCKRYLIMVFLCIFYIFLAMYMNIFSKMLVPFVVTELEWTKSSAAYLFSSFHQAMVLSRFVGIFAVRFLPLEAFFFGQLTLCSTVMIIMSVFIHVSPLILWVGTPLFGLAVGNMMPLSVIWTDKHIGMTGYAISINTIAPKFCELFAPSLVTVLLKKVSSESFLYLTSASTIGALCVLGIAQVVAGSAKGEK
jgi:hypothetical protein